MNLRNNNVNYPNCATINHSHPIPTLREWHNQRFSEAFNLLPKEDQAYTENFFDINDINSVRELKRHTSTDPIFTYLYGKVAHKRDPFAKRKLLSLTTNLNPEIQIEAIKALACRKPWYYPFKVLARDQSNTESVR